MLHDPLDCTVDIILNIRPDHILCTLDDPSALVKDCALSFAVWKYSHTTHDRLDRIGVDDTFLHTWNEESGFATLELVVQVDEEGVEG